jgi:RNA polymerase sigma factor (sigma-70 family)
MSGRAVNLVLGEFDAFWRPPSGILDYCNCGNFFGAPGNIIGDRSVSKRKRFEHSRIRPMSYSFPATWNTVANTVPTVPVQVNQLSNHDLVLRCQGQARPAREPFSELMRRYQSHVEKVLYHLAPDWQDRADLCQEVWIRVYRNIPRLQEPEKFRGWLSRIATNLFYDELRKRKRNAPPLSLDAPLSFEDGEVDWELPAATPGPDEDMVTREFYDQLQAAIADLPEVFRTTIVLREIEGMAYEEIAEITGVNLGTVKSRIARARSRLQEQLQGYLDGGKA